MANKETFYNMGFRITYPEVFEDTKGQVSPMEIGDGGDGILLTMFSYMAISQEDLKAFGQKSESGELSEEDKLKIGDVMGSLLVVIGVSDKLSLKEIAEKMKMQDASEDSFIEVGRYKDIVYYAIIDHNNDASFIKVMEPRFAEEFPTLQSALIEALKKAEYIGPQIAGATLVGKTLHFETQDIEGNQIKSEDLFSKHAITMLNIWATWCGPCKKELEELGKMHRRLEAKNAAIVGICDDSKEKMEECKALIDKNNLSYLNVLPYEGMEELEVESLPTTFFVNQEGKILIPPIIGVPGDISDYEKTIDSLLNQESTDDSPSISDEKTEETNLCHVLVVEEDGSPITGATVQFCSDTTCRMAKTDANGTASFKAEEGPYTVHIQNVPEGYEKKEEEFAVSPNLDDIKIILKKA
ncbi:MAG: redoxin domain-containing protein [Solobacterium sp.]|nr:redoxin domain-containing protein [Solobacterium sp.]